MNTIERILLDHSTEKIKTVEPGDFVNVNLDLVILLDIAGTHTEFTNNYPVHPFNKDKLYLVFDHFSPAGSVEIANSVDKIRKLGTIWDIKNIYSYGDGGISHALGRERGWFKPGMIIGNTDSHSIAAGSFNCLSRGLGTPEIMNAISTGTTWYQVGETVYVNMEGEARPPIEGKDIFLYLASILGSIPGNNIEFEGSGIKTLPLEERAVIATMCAELSAEFAIFPFDNILKYHLDNLKIEGYKPYYPDPDYRYKNTIDINLYDIKPMIALPDKIVGNIRLVEDVSGREITEAVVGSCSNGKLSDLAIAAQMLHNRKISKDVKFIVTPATTRIYLQALKLGYIEKIINAGGIVTNPTCGVCFGGNMGVAGKNDIVITSTTRNFKGRMGDSNAKIYLSSTATVVASAIHGYISTPERDL
jgi:3-isopropylmalate/(R)-2-methylmalate dehydratase large subunit